MIIHDMDIPAMIEHGKPFEILQDKYDPANVRKDYAYYPEYLKDSIITDCSVAIFKVTPKIKKNVQPNL